MHEFPDVPTPDFRPIHCSAPLETLVDDPEGYLVHCLLKELLALPPSVLDRPIFRKIKGHLENYRKNFT